ncbi:flagellar hook-length control protein FliK [Bythopirellula polymerisocia]|uniref:Flagellar hook-length control protein FliK n=1 Tax=Bythopirellula polymerisocia TaxID=2528003 RepID=A0A5C6CVU8_9BACT|nr:flagellar hook-length control protein FliK [Bythopirellula polymerisocia]TWU27804.1 Flagellar hook-length control protein FliK [Bythopirellula polymerisocia]
MSTTSISSLLNIVAPTATASVVPAEPSKDFDRFLHKATTPVTAADKPIPKQEPESAQPESAPSNEPAKTPDQEQAANPEDRGDAEKAADEQPVAKSQKVEASEKPEDDQDELILTEAAVAATTLQSVDSQEPQVEAPVQGLEANAEGTNEDSEQPQAESTLKTLSHEESSSEDQQAEAGSALADAEVETHENEGLASTAKLPNQASQSAVKSQAENPQPAAKQETRLRSESNDTSSNQLEANPSSETGEPKVSTAAQRPTPVVDAATDLGQLATDNSSPGPASSGGPSSSSATAVQITSSATQARTEASQSHSRTEPAVTTVDRGRFVQRVANAFRTAQQDNGEIQLRLSPPELGSLKIEIAVRSGVLTAKLEAETADARRVLLDNLPALRQRLAEQEIRIEKFEVDIRRDGGQGQSGTEDRQSRDESSRGNTAQRNRMSAQPEVTTSRVSRSLLNPSPDSLDVRI